jgi:iron complex outermembrane receptor protein
VKDFWKHTVSAGALTAVSGMFVVPPAHAQSGSSAAVTSQDDGRGLEEVVVTARRISENIEKVPLGISALSGAQLEKQGVATEADLQVAVPGLIVRDTTGSNQFNFALCGQTVDTYSDSPPGVVTYFDDIQSVQVLKGRQGTLFGRNATGGAVLYEATQPTMTSVDGYFLAREGNYGSTVAQGAINLPINSTLAIRVAGSLTYGGAYSYNLYDDKWQGGQHDRTGRVTILFQPMDDFTNTTTVQFNYNTGSTAPGVLTSVYSCGSTGPGGVPLVSASDCLYNPAFPSFAAYLAAHPKAYPGGLSSFLQYQNSLGPSTTDQETPDSYKEESGIVINKTTYNIGDDLTLKNILGASMAWNMQFGYNYDSSPYGIFFAQNYPEKNAQYSEELQLQGKAFESKLTYTTGVFYSYEHDEEGGPAYGFDLSPAIPATLDEFGEGTRDRSVAGFDQATYQVDPQWRVTGGIRYS